MSLKRWLGLMLARLVALAVAAHGLWMFVINAIELDYDGWVLAWILLAGLAGVAGGLLFLLSFDGPRRFRTRTWRMWGWGLMLGSVLLPTSFGVFLVPLVVLVLPGFLIVGNPGDEPGEMLTSQ